MADYVKSIDTNHLVEAGLEGFYGKTSPQRTNLNTNVNVGTDFIANNAVPAIDFATTHVYPDQWLTSSNDQTQLSFLSDWLNAHIQDSQDILNKPLLISEFGKSQDDPGFTADQRDLLYKTVYYNIYSSARRGGAAAGGLFWQLLAEGMDNFGDGYEIILSRRTSTANLIAQQSHKLYQIRRIFATMTGIESVKRAGVVSRGSGRRQIGN